MFLSRAFSERRERGDGVGGGTKALGRAYADTPPGTSPRPISVGITLQVSRRGSVSRPRACVETFFFLALSCEEGRARPCLGLYLW